MRVTPLDIIQKEFTEVKRGYPPEEVRRFLEEVRESLEEVLKENQRLKDALVARDQEITGLKEGEAGVKETLLLARQLAADVRRGAHREADVIIGEARLEAEQVLVAAHDEYRRLIEQIARLRTARAHHLARMKALLETQAQLLMDLEHEEPIPDDLSPDTGAQG